MKAERRVERLIGIHVDGVEKNASGAASSGAAARLAVARSRSFISCKNARFI